jgi:N-acetylneuraminic acid mutarotase
MTVGLPLETAAQGASEHSGVLETSATSIPNRNRMLPWSVILGVIAIGLLVLWVGIQLSRGAVTQPEVPNPALAALSPRWNTQASLPTARAGLALAAYENQIYALGGETSQGVTGQVERYDPRSDRWETLSVKPVPVMDVSAAVIGGKIYLPGGRLESGKVTDVLEIYDPRLDRWSSGAPLPVGLSAYALAAFEGKLYVFGGWDGEHFVSTAYEYNPERDTWLTKTPMRQAIGYAAAAVAGGKIFILGGRDGGQSLAINQVYQPDRDDGMQNPWSEGKAMPEPRSSLGVASLADILYVVGGENNNPGPLKFLQYLPQQDEWQDLESLVLNRWTRLGLAPMETKIYVVGGELDGAPTSQNLSFQAIYSVLFPVVK